MAAYVDKVWIAGSPRECDYDFISDYIVLCTVAQGGNCDIDVDERSSSPCQNGATFSDSSTELAVSAESYRYQCTMVESTYSTVNDGNCNVDMNECVSSPCANGGACKDSTLDLAVPTYQYSCACVDGFANGLCLYEFSFEHFDLCNVASSASGDFSENCDVDVGECASSPCSHNSTCHECESDWHCDCSLGLNSNTRVVEAYDGEQYENAIDVCVCDEDDCDPVNGICHHLGPGLHTCSYHSGWYGNGSTCFDIDGCASTPCVNSYECACVARYAGLDCQTEIIQCDVSPCQNGGACTNEINAHSCECADGYSGEDCVIDIDECASSPCQNGATCSEEGDTSAFEVDLYSCVCLAGFANGMCSSSDGYITEYGALCNVATGGNCDIDVDECASSPCQNGAACSDSHDDSSMPYHTYRCTCHEGYTSSDCGYDNIGEYDASCTIMDAGAALAAEGAGNCEVDLDECGSSPCANLATCTDSTDDPNNIPVDAYSCSCLAGYTNGNCSYTVILEFAIQCTVPLGGNCDVGRG